MFFKVALMSRIPPARLAIVSSCAGADRREYNVRRNQERYDPMRIGSFIKPAIHRMRTPEPSNIHIPGSGTAFDVNERNVLTSESLSFCKRENAAPLTML